MIIKYHAKLHVASTAHCFVSYFILHQHACVHFSAAKIASLPALVLKFFISFVVCISIINNGVSFTVTFFGLEKKKQKCLAFNVMKGIALFSDLVPF